MNVSRASFAQRILAALGVDAQSLIDAPRDKLIASSTLSIHGIDRFVIPHYETLSGGVRCKLVHSRVNDTYAISSANRQYSLKIYRVNWRSLESIRQELACIEGLHAGGIPIATPIARRDGDTITRIPTPEGMRYAVLFDWVRGDVPSFANQTHSAQIGRYLARLHAAGDRTGLDRTPRCLGLAELFERPCARIRPYIEDNREQVERFDTLVARLSRQVQQATAQLDDWGFCHGDAAHVNLSIEGDCVHFFDFEWCGSGWRVYDLATYIWSAYHFGRFRDFQSQALVHGYLQERPELAADAEFIPLFIVVRHLWHASQYIELAPHLGTNLIANGFFENLITFCEDRGHTQ